ncbi:hypothetical protein PT285_04555 [Lactobacillus sp. ESL0791]|uniref:hypothetical protein n=1 Tax=Lactobacillus sp. ESL0791 TaxID=2983234 RepID=UPI0023F9AB25|nr:hypothetical protein [Lactobacillus sp. ESL0791]MDF7638669.1 hypothetical protein [Lactobacillus sp. ESL0791]
MRYKKILAATITSLGLIGSAAINTSAFNQPVVAAKVKTSHTVPKKLRGSWYQHNIGTSWAVQKYTKNTQALYDTGQKPHYRKVTVKKYNNNKYLIYIGKKMPQFRQYLSTTSINYKGKKLRTLVVNDHGHNTYYFNKKIRLNYNDANGSFYKR